MHADNMFILTIYYIFMYKNGFNEWRGWFWNMTLFVAIFNRGIGGWREKREKSPRNRSANRSIFLPRAHFASRPARARDERPDGGAQNDRRHKSAPKIRIWNKNKTQETYRSSPSAVTAPRSRTTWPPCSLFAFFLCSRHALSTGRQSNSSEGGRPPFTPVYAAPRPAPERPWRQWWCLDGRSR